LDRDDMTNADGSDAVLADRIIIRLIAAGQMFMAIAGAVILLFGSMYGGAGAHPKLFLGLLLYVLCGFGTALFLYSRTLTARILALGWHMVLLGCVVWFSTQRPLGGSPSLEAALTSSALSRSIWP
jgi:hypothetical protein